MKEAGIPPNEVTYTTLMNKVTDFESARSVLEEMKEAGIPPNLLTYCTLFSKDINNLSLSKVYDWYKEETYHPSSALEPLIKQLYKNGRLEDAYFLVLNYPDLECSKKIIRENAKQSISYLIKFKGNDFYDKNIDYVLGIAYYSLGKYKKSQKHLIKALSVAETPRRKKHISELLESI